VFWAPSGKISWLIVVFHGPTAFLTIDDTSRTWFLALRNISSQVKTASYLTFTRFPTFDPTTMIKYGYDSIRAVIVSLYFNRCTCAAPPLRSNVRGSGSREGYVRKRSQHVIIRVFCFSSLFDKMPFPPPPPLPLSIREKNTLIH